MRSDSICPITNQSNSNFVKGVLGRVAPVIAAFAMLASSVAVAQSASRTPQSGVSPAPGISSGVSGAMGSAPPSPADLLAQSLAQIGLTNCAGAVQRAAAFLFEDGAAAFTVQPLGPNANIWPTVISIESAHPPSGQTRFSTVTIAPGQSCAGFYEQVIVWPVRCDELGRTVFSGFTATRKLLNQVQVSELNAGLQLYLMPHQGGRGCTSIKRELFR